MPRDYQNRNICEKCAFTSSCIAINLSDTELDLLDGVVKKQRTLKRGEFLFQPRECFQSLFGIRHGIIKLARITETGKEQVMGFYFPGEILGFHAIDREQYDYFATAIEITSVCEISYSDLFTAATKIASLQKQLLSLMSQQISTVFTIPANTSAEQKLALFLLNIIDRNHRQSQLALKIPLKREDIANHLGLAPETVSRIFSRFTKEKIIQIQCRKISIVDLDKLKAKASENIS